MAALSERLSIWTAVYLIALRHPVPVARQVAQEMNGAPFLGAFTFGEQGAIIDSSNRHGNLMVSALAFGE